jgi:hypothetical protein
LIKESFYEYTRTGNSNPAETDRYNFFIHPKVKGKYTMRHFKLSFLPGVLALATLLIRMQPVAPVAANSLRNATASSCGGWNLVSIPTREQRTSDLYALAAISSNDIWTVGLSYPDRVLAPSATLTEHWNGSSWNIIPSANYGSNSNHLYGVAAASSNDVWAVGDYYIDHRGSGGKTLIERWNGTQWSVVPSPNGGNAFSELYAVAAVSSNDVWAVGNFINLSPFQDQTLIEHWAVPPGALSPAPIPVRPITHWRL